MCIGRSKDGSRDQEGMYEQITSLSLRVEKQLQAANEVNGERIEEIIWDRRSPGIYSSSAVLHAWTPKYARMIQDYRTCALI